MVVEDNHQLVVGNRDLRGKPSSLLTTGKGSLAARRSCQLNEDLWEGG